MSTGRGAFQGDPNPSDTRYLITGACGQIGGCRDHLGRGGKVQELARTHAKEQRFSILDTGMSFFHDSMHDWWHSSGCSTPAAPIARGMPCLTLSKASCHPQMPCSAATPWLGSLQPISMKRTPSSLVHAHTPPLTLPTGAELVPFLRNK